ncbi:MAG: BolA family transcriptional regulator [Chlamydiae bacterium]|nr:BolA family transcriptional regulator [Chlamydiota bacterium]MBI3277224.1 BolA family transcriptional regulator [Chlamydiota bacterium]
MTAEQIKSRILEWAKGTEAQVIDLTGTQDHYQAVIISPIFTGKMMMEQHKMVYALFQKEIQSGELHALTLKTYSPEQHENPNIKNQNDNAKLKMSPLQ